MTDNPFKTEGNNINAFDLVQSIQLLIESKQWNEVMRFLAATKPKDFISMVEHFRENGELTNLLAPGPVELWLTGIGYNKIECIKVLREVFNLALVDAKYTCDAVPIKLCKVTNKSDDLAYCITKLREVNCHISVKLISPEPKYDNKDTIAAVEALRRSGIIKPVVWNTPATFRFPEIDEVL